MQPNLLVTIFIPCYNQPKLLRRCLESVRAQSFTNFQVLLMDDKSAVSYQEILTDFADLRIRQIVNTHNLGAVPNMVHCIKFPVSTRYKIVFHEDDLMHPQLLARQVAAFKLYPNAAWVGTNMCFFNDPQQVQFPVNTNPPLYLIGQIKPLVKAIVTGNALSLGSIMYQCAYTSFIHFDLETYSMLGDRQMLLELGRKYGCVYLNKDLVAAYDHASEDKRWNTLRHQHILNYYQYLRSFFTADELKEKEISSGFTRAIVEKIKLLPAAKATAVARLIPRMYYKQLISPKYLVLELPIARRFFDKILNR